MKRGRIIFTALLLPVDYIMLVVSGILIYYARFNVMTQFRPAIFEIPFQRYFVLTLVVAFVWLILLVVSGLYAREKRNLIGEFFTIFSAITFGAMFLVLYIFFNRELFNSRFIILAAWFLTPFIVMIGRIIIFYAQRRTFKKGKLRERLLLIGHSEEAQKIEQYIRVNPFLGYEISARYYSLEELKNDSREWFLFDAVVLCDRDWLHTDILKLHEVCEQRQLIMQYVADTFSSLASNSRVIMMGGYPFIEVMKTPLETAWKRIEKRVADVVGVIFFLILSLPFFILVPIAITLDSSGPIFVRLLRVGERARKFYIYKFRSMVKDAHLLKEQLKQYNERGDGPLFKMKDDPRVTRVGAIIRRLSIDELPQLWNVLKGEMSVVGPRPHEPQEVLQYGLRHQALLRVKPGITGLAQISGRSELSFEDEARLDMYYLEHWTIFLDIWILLKTVGAVFRGK
ncbi:MAG: sugar transferase [Parcubacteria group bacterium]|nr:sugar transferase [Parcubacteria group bacterium]